MFLFLCKIFYCKFQVRLFGSDLDLIYNESILKRVCIKLIKKTDQVLLQTKGLISFWSNSFPNATKPIWYPTSRLMNNVNMHIINVNKKVKFLYIGHINKQKGINIILNADKLLSQDLEAEYEITIIGRCDDLVLKNKLKNRKNITFDKEVHNSKINAIMRDHHVLLFPSIWKGEGYPGVLIESMMNGLPIISSNWRFLNELVIDNYNGFLINPSNDNHLFITMKKIIESPKTLIDMSKNCIEFSTQFDANKWLNFYINSLLGLEECVE